MSKGCFFKMTLPVAALFALGVQTVNAATYYVPRDYATIGAAFSRCNAGDVIELTGDCADEHPITINKSITINGNNHGVWTYENIPWQFSASRITVNGVQFSNYVPGAHVVEVSAGTSYNAFHSCQFIGADVYQESSIGLYDKGSRYLDVRNCLFGDTKYGIYGYNTKHAFIWENEFGTLLVGVRFAVYGGSSFSNEVSMNWFWLDISFSEVCVKSKVLNTSAKLFLDYNEFGIFHSQESYPIILEGGHNYDGGAQVALNWFDWCINPDRKPWKKTSSDRIFACMNNRTSTGNCDIGPGCDPY